MAKRNSFNDSLTEQGGVGMHVRCQTSLKATDEETEQLVSRLLDLASSEIPASRPVRNLISSMLVTMRGRPTLEDAKLLMETHGHRTLIAVGVQHALVGVISMQGITLDERRRDDSELNLSVSEWMHRIVLTVAPDRPIRDADKVLVDSSVGMVPIDGRERDLFGVITRMDVGASVKASAKVLSGWTMEGLWQQ